MCEICDKTTIQKLQQQLDELDKKITLFEGVLTNDVAIDDKSASILRNDIRDFQTEKHRINNVILTLKTQQNG